MATVLVLVLTDIVQFDGRIVGCLVLWNNKNWQYQFPLILKHYVSKGGHVAQLVEALRYK